MVFGICSLKSSWAFYVECCSAVETERYVSDSCLDAAFAIVPRGTLPLVVGPLVIYSPP